MLLGESPSPLPTVSIVAERNQAAVNAEIPTSGTQIHQTTELMHPEQQTEQEAGPSCLWAPIAKHQGIQTETTVTTYGLPGPGYVHEDIGGNQSLVVALVLAVW